MAIPSAQIAATSGQSASVISRSRTPSVIPENEDRPPTLATIPARPWRSAAPIRRPTSTRCSRSSRRATAPSTATPTGPPPSSARSGTTSISRRDAWVAVDDGRIAGVVHVYGLRGTRVLLDGYVHPELTGRGAGSLLLDAAEARARELAGDAPAGEPIWAETAHLVGDPTAPGAPRRARLHDAPHLPPHGHRPRARDPGAVVARRPRVASVRPRAARPAAEGCARRGVRRRVGPRAARLRRVGRAGPRGAAVRPRVDPGRLGRRRDRCDGGRLPEAPRRLGPDLAARRAAGMAQARARAVAAPGELPPLRRAGRDDGCTRRRQREPDRRHPPLRARGDAHPLARRCLAQGAAAWCQAHA